MITIRSDDFKEFCEIRSAIAELHENAELGKSTGQAHVTVRHVKSKKDGKQYVYYGFRRTEDGRTTNWGTFQDQDSRIIPFFARRPEEGKSAYDIRPQSDENAGGQTPVAPVAPAAAPPAFPHAAPTGFPAAPTFPGAPGAPGFAPTPPAPAFAFTPNQAVPQQQQQ